MATAGRPPIPRPKERKKSIVVVPSRVGTSGMLSGAEETEIAVQVLIPPDGGWGWVVLACAFMNSFILDGTIYSFGVILFDMSQELAQGEAPIALLNSVQVTILFVSSPLVCALINRFGFRVCNIIGSIICCSSLLASYFSKNYVSLMVFYGCFSGFGYALLNMSTGLIVGFYFEKRRAIATAISTSGSSLGLAIMFPLEAIVVERCGWRTVVLLNSGLVGMAYFLGLSYRPLVSLTVTKTEENEENPTRTVTLLPNLATRKSEIHGNQEGIAPTGTERMFNAVANSNFPTAAAIYQEDLMPTTLPVTDSTVSNQAGPSSTAGGTGTTGVAGTAGRSKITLAARGELTPRQLNQVKSMMSRGDIKDIPDVAIEITVQTPKKRGCCGRLCHWEPHVSEARPMYKDDAFFNGHIKTLPEYQKSMANVKEDQRTGFEYQMAVSRAVTVNDLKEKRGVFSTAVRRVLATMMDVTLIKKLSFQLFCSSGFVAYCGVLVPFIFLKARNEDYGIDKTHCDLFLSVIGMANILGRITLSILTTKFEVLKIYIASVMVAGFSTIVSPLCTNVVFQYGYSFAFGFFISVMPSMRSVLIVSLYGLEKLTNAMGMVLLFVGLGSLISTPMAGVLKGKFGYDVAFYVSGVFIILGGMFLIPVGAVSKREKEQEKRIRNSNVNDTPKLK